MTEVALFSNDEFRLEITPDDANGFLADTTQVARCLGYRDAHDLLRSIPADERRTAPARTPNGGQRTNLTERGESTEGAA